MNPDVTTEPVARYDIAMSNAQAPKTFTPGQRVRSKGVKGTFVGYYAELPSGTRNVNVAWDDRSLVMTLHESQIEAI